MATRDSLAKNAEVNAFSGKQRLLTSSNDSSKSQYHGLTKQPFPVCVTMTYSPYALPNGLVRSNNSSCIPNLNFRAVAPISLSNNGLITWCVTVVL